MPLRPKARPAPGSTPLESLGLPPLPGPQYSGRVPQVAVAHGVRLTLEQERRLEEVRHELQVLEGAPVSRSRALRYALELGLTQLEAALASLSKEDWARISASHSTRADSQRLADVKPLDPRRLPDREEA